MLNSKSNQSGNVTRSKLSTSGGVIMAAITMITINECFRYLLKKVGVTTPILVKKRIRTGSSKRMPVAKVTDATDEIKEVRLIWFDTSLEIL